MPDSWVMSLKQSFTNPDDLLEYLDLQKEADKLSKQPSFPFLVPKFFASLMKKGQCNDPLLRQVLPLCNEEVITPSALIDPLQEHKALIKEGVMQKFQSRVLVMTSGHCAINCRYCFRRHFPYQTVVPKLKVLQDEILSLKDNTNIKEIIFSGGDPLILPNRSLEKLIDTCQDLDNVNILRFHTRLPVVIPHRVEKNFCDILKQSRKKIVMVLHINHANEISEKLQEKVDFLSQYNIPVYNQSVLLKGVNDTVQAQKDLWEKGFLSSILPYYLHQLDNVQGASHFRVEVEKGRFLIDSLRKELPGYMLPRYVAEIPGAPHKVPLD